MMEKGNIKYKEIKLVGTFKSNGEEFSPNDSKITPDFGGDLRFHREGSFRSSAPIIAYPFYYRFTKFAEKLLAKGIIKYTNSDLLEETTDEE